ncbi:MAG: hypothetical protein WAK22_20770, partial [Candidatus Sulfotelmatobacter sp.]
MKFRSLVLVAATLVLLPPIVPQSALAAPRQSAAQAQSGAAAPQATAPPPSSQPQGSAPLRVMVDKSLLINTTER